MAWIRCIGDSGGGGVEVVLSPFSETAGRGGQLSFTGVPRDVENIVVHQYRDQFVFMFLRHGETLTYSNGQAEYINCYRTSNFSISWGNMSGKAVSYNTESSGNYIGLDPTWNTCIYNTCDLYDDGGNLMFSANCTLENWLPLISFAT